MPQAIPISRLPAASALNGAEIFVADQGLVTTGPTANQIATFVATPINETITAFEESLASQTGGALIGVNDGQGGSLFTTVQGFITKLLSSVGIGLLAFSQAAAYPAGSVGSHIAASPLATDAPYGADKTGTNDCSAALVAAAAAGAFTIPAGTYKVSSSTTINAYVTLAPGAILKPQNGVTITFAGGISAGAYQIFQPVGTGAITFTSQPPFGFSEWWGFVTGNPAYAASNLIAMNAALVALQTTQLLPAIYYVSGTVIHATGGHTLQGAGPGYNSGSGQASLLASTSASLPILQVGASVNPGSPNGMPVGIVARDMLVIRSLAPNISSDCDGVLFQYVVGGKLENIKSQDSMNSFHITGVVGSYVTECQATRVLAGSGAGTDSWNGYWLDGSNNIGAAGGNASIYLTRCQAGCNIGSLQTAGSNAYYIYAGNYGFQDTFLDHCESVSCHVGTNIAGGGGGQADVRIVHQTDDQVTGYGLLISNLTPMSALSITDYYCGVSATVAAGIYINNSVGPINFSGGQVLLGGISGVPGVGINASGGVSIRGMIISEVAGANAVALGGSSNCVIEPIIHNASHSTTGAAVQLSGTCTGNAVKPLVYGQANAFNIGIQVVGTADNRNTYDVGGIDSACIGGGYPSKLFRNGATALTSATMVPAYVGTNLVTGCTG